jgi:hypothetical protein
VSARLDKLERELAQARARIAELEEKLTAALEATDAGAITNVEILREWNAELDAAGGEEGVLTPTKLSQADRDHGGGR